MTGIRSIILPPRRDAKNPFKRPPSRWPRWLGRAALVVVVLLSIVVVVWCIDALRHACGELSSGVTKIDGECVGVTDGSYVFDSDFADVEKKIAAENARVQGSGRTVTIALLGQLTADATSARSLPEVRNELEGAYTAQQSVNQTRKLGDNYPLIRLVLANQGSHQNQWRQVVEQLEGMVGETDPLVAVTGFEVSTTNTQLAAQHLSAHGIPMVSSSAAADDLTYTNIRGFIRISPSTQEDVQGLLKYLQGRPGLDSAMLVYDANSDDPASPDLFPRSLRNDLSDSMKSLIMYPAQSFIGKSGSSDANPDLFGNVISNLCAVKPKVVLYAGRQRDLSSFLAGLENRVCLDSPITIITVATDLSELKSDEAKLRDTKLTVAYATSSDPYGWANTAAGKPPHFDDFRSEFGSLFDHADIDGGAVAEHDAVLAAVRAIRLATLPTAHSMPKPADVLGQLLNLNGQNAIPGASGDMSFSYRGDKSGDPIGKPIPVLEIPSSESTSEEVTIYITGNSP